MFDFFSQVLEHVAPFVVATHLLFMLAAAAICSLVVVLLVYYLVRFAGFAISWQPKDFVGAPRNPRQSDPSSTPGTTANERHAPTLLRQTAPISPLKTGDKLEKELLDMASESARKIRAKCRLSEDDVCRLRALENLMQKLQERQPQKELTK
ncbi:hypothetical protein CfE428DRAFT_5573 [Chthoniobacter flavus Ellin428]|uniref:Uncharacterized protein n=1 Tax=Chthoniobacter flavus Ellin428 TaxID=497964 RepID=B4D9I3_9BACT|nr:hypothetical protein [Chthoniobacter flavus]EDY16944.1 hypothetical protein CfE428DRAFT_5573 [Chthoniobacter flavus Ellin428]TCO87821.1 hypothetical protein EV701_120120 [Chthoniobacter flavus]